MKAALNGALNLSILDGWWDECFDGENGWAISSAEHLDDLERRDEVEAGSLFELLERQVVPLFYERLAGPGPPPLGAAREAQPRHARPVRHRRAHGARLHRASSTSRPPRQGDALRADGYAAAPRAGRRGRREVDAAWPGVHVDHVELDDSLADLGTERSVEAIVALGDLGPDDVEVQLLHGPAGQGQELAAPEVVVLEPAGAADDGHLRYRGRFTCEQAGRYGITVRIVPTHADLVNPVELGKVAWA